ncbi:hypothetical protein [Streptomyces sp. NPDC054756]
MEETVFRLCSKKAPAVFLTALAVLSAAGCSGGGGGGAARSVSTASSAAESAGKPLSVQDLKSLALTADEVPGNRGVEVREAASGSESTFPPVSVTSCQPLVDFVQADGASASVIQVFNWEKDVSGGQSTLSYYGVDGAERAFQRVREALKKCDSYTAEGYAGEYTADVEVEQAPEAGDEAVAFRETTSVKSFDEAESMTAKSEYVCVRTGGAVVVFNKSGYGRDVKFPRQLIEKQVDRLDEAQH